MDANGTRLHLLLGRDDWAQCREDDGRPVFDPHSALAWDDAANELTLAARVLEFNPSPGNRKPSLSDRRGAARDRFGSWYWISDDGREIKVASAGSGLTSHFWASTDKTDRARPVLGGFSTCTPETDPPALEFSGLAVTRDHYLVCGVLDPKGLVVFDLFHGGPPRELLWPTAAPFVPFDMSAAPDGGVWILDRENLRLWRLNRAFDVVPAGPDRTAIEPAGGQLFQSCDGSAAREAGARTFPLGDTLEAGSPIAARHPVAIEALPDDSVLILDSDPAAVFSTIYRYRDGRQVGAQVSTAITEDLIEAAFRVNFTLLATDFAYVAKETTPTGKRYDILYVAADTGDQVFAFRLSVANDQIAIKPIAEYLPMRLWGGRALAAAGGQPWYDSRSAWVPLIEQRRPRYLDTGALTTRALDGKQPGCVWHRFLLDACMTPDTDVHVWSRAHDNPDALPLVPWTREPDPYRRGDGSEQPWAWRIDNTNYETLESLPQRARGRYLQLRIALTGSGRSSPRVRALRVYYPRFSYPEHYLPATYRRDAPSASFLDRFLSNIEGFYTGLEDKIANSEILFDPRTAPPDTLDWLANWFGIALDPAWDPAKRRLFLRYAMQFFEARGTVPGLVMALRLVLEDCATGDLFTDPAPKHGTVRIVEKFRTRITPGIVLGDATEGLGLPLTPQQNRWTPSQRASDLHARYRTAFKLMGNEQYPIRPADVPASSLAAWRDFSQTTLGFIPTWTNTPEKPFSTAALWRDFLVRRYGTVARLNDAYGTSYSGFDAIPMPSELPSASVPLVDWYQFQGSVLKMRDAAHRFTVFLPIQVRDAADPVVHDNKLKLAQRVIGLEKPAHTAYEVKFYWAFFRVGEARLGEESVLDLGSRAPQLMRPATLGSTAVGSSYFDRGTACSPKQRLSLRGNCASPSPCLCPSEENPI